MADVAAEYAKLKASVISPGNATGCYDVSNVKLGAGAFGTVYPGLTKKSPQQKVAVKYISSKLYVNAQQRYDALREPYMLGLVGKANDSHILKLMSAHEETLQAGGQRLVIVTEMASGGELFDRLASIQHYSEKDAARVAYALFKALNAVHASGVIHRDLKPENVLMRAKAGQDGADDIIVADFGLSMLLSEPCNPKSSPVGTYAYMAPETWLRRQYGPGSDVWALGVLLYILLVGFPPFWAGEDNDIQKMMDNVCGGRYEFYEDAWSDISKEARELVSRLLEVDPAKRISLPEAMAHHWFTSQHAVPAAATKPLARTLEKLKGFNAKRRFRTAALAVMFSAAGMRATFNDLAAMMGGQALTEEQIGAVSKAFTSAAGVGSAVDFSQFSSILLNVGLTLEPAVLNRMFLAFDRDMSGTIDFRELVAGLAALSRGDAASLRLIFNLFDTDGSGSISKSELGRLLASTGFFQENLATGLTGTAHNPADVEGSAQMAALERVFALMDSNHDNSISFEEFKSAVMADKTLAHALLQPLREIGQPGHGGAGAV